MIPDLKLFQIVKICLVGLRADYEANSGNPEDTILFHLLNDTEVSDTGKYKWLEQATEIFITRDKDHTRFLDANLFFDRERAKIPTIHIMLSGESKGKDGIGMDEGFNPEQVIGDTQRPVLNRQFDINANIVVTSDNAFETVIITHVMKSMLIAISAHIQLSGFINPVIGSRDITLSQDLAPNGIFARSINFSAGYELSVPVVVLNQIISSVWFQMKKINGVTLDEPIGPGPISADNNNSYPYVYPYNMD